MATRKFTKYPAVVTASTQLTADSLSDLLLSKWIEASFNLWGYEESELADMEDALYSDSSYRHEFASYLLKEHPAVVNVDFEEDEDGSDIIVSAFDEDDNLLGTVRSWYSGGRYDFETLDNESIESSTCVSYDEDECDVDHVLFFYDEDSHQYRGEGEVVASHGDTLEEAVKSAIADAKNYDKYMYDGVSIDDRVDRGESDPDDLGELRILWHFAE